MPSAPSEAEILELALENLPKREESSGPWRARPLPGKSLLETSQKPDWAQHIEAYLVFARSDRANGPQEVKAIWLAS